jgi:uncharacterized protein YecT (DUF1311 family)
MYKFQTLVILLTGLVTLTPAWADDAPNCDNQMDQQTMNQCAGLDYEKADAELNTVWKAAKKAAEDADTEYSDDLKGEAEALLKAQRGWIAYRDGQCDLAGFEARGGSMESMLVSGCLAEMTKARTKELQAFIDGPAQ